MDLVDLNGMWPKWVENTVKAVTVVATVVAVGAVVVGTGGAAAVVVAGALTTGVVSGFANEASGGSYTNGFIGGTVQSIASFAGPVGNVAGGAANGLGPFITDSLDNIDSSVVKKKYNEDVIKDAGINAAKGTLFSLPGGFMQWATSTSNTTAQELMKGYNSNSVYGTC